MMTDAIRLDSSRKPLAEGCTSATLSLSSDSAGVLSLTFSGAGPAWVSYMQPVCLYHHGRLLFAGRVVRFSRSNAAGAVETQVEVCDFRWLLEQQTFGAQVAAARESTGSGSSSGRVIYTGGSAQPKALGIAASKAARSWHALASYCALPAPDWAVESDVISLDVSRARLSFSGPDYSEKGCSISAWTVLRDMQSANPDCAFRVDYASGTLSVISVSRADEVVWSTAERPIEGLDTIEPQHDRRVDGVLIFVTYPNAQGVERLITRSVPSFIPDSATRVPSFSSSADKPTRALIQASHLTQQAAKYMAAVNELMWGGSISTRIEAADASLVACRLSVTGPGTRPEWASMRTLVSAEEWDFTTGRLTLTLGKEWADPTLSQLQWDPDSDSDAPDDDDDDSGDGGDKDKDKEEGFLTVDIEELGEPQPDASGRYQSRYLALHAYDASGNDVSSRCSFVLAVEGMDDYPSLDTKWFVDPPGDNVLVTLPSGHKCKASLAATLPSLSLTEQDELTTDPNNEYYKDLLWGKLPPDGGGIDGCDTPPRPDSGAKSLRVSLEPASVVSGSLVIQANVTADDIPDYKPDEMCMFFWQITLPAKIRTGDTPLSLLSADYAVEPGSSDAKKTISYSLVVTDKTSGASAYASGQYVPKDANCDTTPPDSSDLMWRKLQVWADSVQRTLMRLGISEVSDCYGLKVSFKDLGSDDPRLYDLDLGLSETPHQHSTSRISGNTSYSISPAEITRSPNPSCPGP